MAEDVTKSSDQTTNVLKGVAVGARPPTTQRLGSCWRSGAGGSRRLRSPSLDLASNDTV
jgi:hypothetical protein